jgi:hypothetical protein
VAVLPSDKLSEVKPTDTGEKTAVNCALCPAARVNGKAGGFTRVNPELGLTAAVFMVTLLPTAVTVTACD